MSNQIGLLVMGNTFIIKLNKPRFDFLLVAILYFFFSLTLMQGAILRKAFSAMRMEMILITQRPSAKDIFVLGLLNAVLVTTSPQSLPSLTLKLCVRHKLE